ncbi:MAG: tRNA uridine-5-carboxymethylaminomethyl(34) synthesis GTPase MnmE [Firmicutes bacterium]|nr:tRNA uridine-5-carboxymethylaminomethyl(34) synthesis GTPase MnmE [Bacillota bacterium]
MIEDTIAAISTPLGEGGIGIIRVSGSDAFQIARKIFKPAKADNLYSNNGHRLIYGYVYDHNQKVVDEILLGIMHAPHTFTREDVVEFNCHGGLVPQRKTLELLLEHGARLAEPGEFTKRAFLNGRLDLAQAESIIDVIRAKTDAGLDVALNQLKGRLSSRVGLLQEKLLGIMANIEVSIDFSEEELGEASTGDLKSGVINSLEEIESLLESAKVGKIYREGIHTVIVGKPNVGKSSLLNALLRDKRAIVTEIPGTTRDIIEEVLNIRGIPLRLVDTAGLRTTEDVVERIGVERSTELVKQGELILLVLDASAELDAEDKEIMDLVKGKKGIIIFNKIDIKGFDIINSKLPPLLSDWPVVAMSVLRGEGLNKLEDKIEQQIVGANISASDSILISNVRHKNALSRGRKHLKDVLNGMEEGVPIDLLAIDVRGAWEILGEITGETVSEDLVDKIFSDFCVGK